MAGILNRDSVGQSKYLNFTFYGKAKKVNFFLNNV